MKVCGREGCTLPHHAKGWCRMHYNRVRWGGEPGELGPILGRHKGCNFPGCDRPHHAKGWCVAHRTQMRRGLQPTPLHAARRTSGPQPKTLQMVSELRVIVGTDSPERVAHRLGYLNAKSLVRVLYRIGEKDLARKIEHPTAVRDARIARKVA